MQNELLRFDKKKKFVHIDVETQNVALHHSINLPWQIACLTSVGGRVTNTENMYVKYPFELKVSPMAAKITHYDPRKIAQFGIPAEQAFKRTMAILETADFIVGHNIIGFDIYLLRSLAHFLKKPFDAQSFLNKMIDTACLLKGIKMGTPYKNDEFLVSYQYRVYHKRAEKGIKYSQTAAGKEFQIEHDYENLHDAVVDLQLNIKLWDKIKWLVEI